MENKKSIFKKTILETSSTGALKRQTTIDLSPWSFEADAEKGTEAISGFTCQMTVLKVGGDKPKSNFINIDPANDDIRQALKDMYVAYDKANKK